MLPYSALHHLLLAEAGRPLVFTSGNPSGGPAVIDHAEALRALSPIVDAFLLHDRAIPRRVEDSLVAQAPIAGGGVRVLRRSRGLSPSPIRLPWPATEPVLAVGGHLKSAACLVVGDQAFLTPHLGDLGYVEGDAAWRRDVEGFERLLGVRAEVLAHDLHPDYGSTRYAIERPARLRVGVQHHVAHVLAAVAEHHLDEPTVGVVFDGTGFGTDGTLWGAEILIVEGARWTRPATFRSLPLPGGERAIREVWRVALGALAEALGEEEAFALSERLGAFGGVPSAARATTLRMIATGTSTPRARGMGRWFDAIGALTLGVGHAGFDGHVAIALEEAAGGEGARATATARAYPVALPGATGSAEPAEIDLRPTVRAVVSDLLDGVGAPEIAARFHAAIVDATATVVAGILADTGLRRVVLSGGSMQNQLLERGLRERLAGRVVVAREVPVNDGGLALGQAWAAVLALRGETA
jgi:hydrogenase maturation protein HypF